MHHLLLAKDLQYMSEATYATLAAETDDIIRQLSAWIKALSSQGEPRT
jgi:hypothetical protein